ncbi:lytic murein transglycosylase [Bosea caraganae]|uniref:peptidoglycan lytic exotransglycosylase n=1 Tax=Bosea caraganae TaxID=2763117 RepID=A0A370KZW3_9HYPH|nr:MltA domain-containing protein [Bosea caraganae]RDJ20525.1 lytic murein transglycosylase [Bosea caraganae]RDJ28374.1 lytic murein transglycosylase [Bosea caraganae]
MIRVAFLAASLLMTAMTPAHAAPPLPPGARAELMSPGGIPGWRNDDQRIPLGIFAAGCAADPPLRPGAPIPPGLVAICKDARALLARGQPDQATARRFFEERFDFWRIRPLGSPRGFMTGYFEPEFAGSLTRSAEYPTPLYDRPADLVTRQQGDDWPGLDPALSSARRTAKGFEPFPDRTAIETGALDGQGLEIIWLRDPVDRFVLQVQGSGRIRLPDGGVVRLVYSGRNGHPYTSLGRTLSEREGIPPAEMTMDRLIARLKADADFARDLIRLNKSFVFFARKDDLPAESGPIGGAGLPLTPLRSIAVDRTLWPYGMPAWIDTEIPAGTGGTELLARLMIAQDTGSAILGPARIDLFVGSGPEAGHRAGLVRHALDFIVLWPREER